MEQISDFCKQMAKHLQCFTHGAMWDGLVPADVVQPSVKHD